MIIDNGARADLVIRDVFVGECGISRGRLAFVPNRAGKRPEEARSGLLGEMPVRLTDVRKDGEGPVYTASYWSLL